MLNEQSWEQKPFCKRSVAARVENVTLHSRPSSRLQSWSALLLRMDRAHGLRGLTQVFNIQVKMPKRVLAMGTPAFQELE